MRWPDGFKAAFSLRVDVESSNCLLKGVPILLGILERYDLRATFFIPMGPDRVGVSFDRGRVGSYLKLNPLRKFGLKAILRGSLLPPLDLGEICLKMGLKASRYEIALHGYDHSGWVHAVRRGCPWMVGALFRKGYSEYRRIFGGAPKGFASPEFRWTIEILEMLDEFNFLYGSDFRGRLPFKPRVNGRIYRTLQIPVSLPNLEELSWAGLRDDKALKAVVKAIEGVIRRGGLAVLLVHPSYEVLLKRSLLESILEYVDRRRDDLWVATMSEVAEYWVEWGLS